jgi:hypothetical protein
MSSSANRALAGLPPLRITFRLVDRAQATSSRAALAGGPLLVCAARGAALAGCGTTRDRASLPAPPIAPTTASATLLASPPPVLSATASSLPASPLPARIVAHRRDAAGPVLSRSNGYGQVAPGAGATQENADRPSAGTGEVVVVPGVREAIDIAAGREHTCALRKDGTVLCWGSG